jgi:hypothetical protein
MQFVSIIRVVEILELDNITKYIKFFSYKWYEKLTLRAIYTEIKYELCLTNYKQQKFQINKKAKELSFVKHAKNSKKSPYRRTKEVLKKYGSFKNSISSISANFTESVISGKNHVANLVGCSASTAANILKKMSEAEIIDRKIVKVYINQAVSNAMFDILRIKYPNAAILPQMKRNNFCIVLGSSIRVVS